VSLARILIRRLTPLAPCLIFSSAGLIAGGLISVNSDVAAVYTQTSGAAPTTPTFYYFATNGQFANAGAFTTGLLTFPGPGSPLSLNISGNTFSYSTPGTYPTLSNFQANFPFGTYTYNFSGGSSAAQSEAVTYAQNSQTTNVPALSPASFNALQNLVPAAGLTLTFNAATPSSNANRYTGQFIISDLTLNYAVVFDSGSFASSTTSVTVPAGTFTSGHSYLYTLYFEDNVDSVDSSQNIQLEQRFDNDTQGTFPAPAVASAPIPSSIILVTVGLIGILVLRNRFQRAHA
jgi:hypothetical protein